MQIKLTGFRREVVHHCKGTFKGKIKINQSYPNNGLIIIYIADDDVAVDRCITQREYIHITSEGV